jgi:hypothetical protein
MDEYGCVNETSAAITISSGFGLTVNTFFDRSLPDSAALLKPDTIGIIESNVFGGTAPYQYQWFEKENTNGKAISTSHQLKITNSIANTSQSESATYYLLKITDKYGCEAISNATLSPLIFRKRYREWKNGR